MNVSGPAYLLKGSTMLDPTVTAKANLKFIESELDRAYMTGDAREIEAALDNLDAALDAIQQIEDGTEYAAIIKLSGNMTSIPFATN